MKPEHDTAMYYEISDSGKIEKAMDDAYNEMEVEDADRKEKRQKRELKQ